MRSSYVRCLKSENELIKIFYGNLLSKLFISTLRGLHQEYHYEWNEPLQAAWDNVKHQSLTVIKYSLSK